MKKLFALLLSLVMVLSACMAMAESGEREWTLENATEVFEETVILPEDAAQYKKVLKARLTDEQAAAFESGMAYIYVPNVLVDADEVAIQVIAYLPVELNEEHQLQAEFAGLYATVVEEMSENLRAQLVTIRPILAARQQSIGEDQASLSLKGVFYGEMDAMFDTFTVGIDYAANTAKIEEISLGETSREPLNGYYSSYRYTYLLPEVKKDTALPHFVNLESTGWTMWYEHKVDEPRTIMLRPVSGAGCMVLFSITNTDGTQYSLAPVAYD